MAEGVLDELTSVDRYAGSEARREAFSYGRDRQPDAPNPRTTGLGILIPDLNPVRGADRLRAEVERLHRTGITVPLVGWRLPVPPPELLTFYATLAALATVELIDWPLAVAIAVGHELARSRRPGMRGIGESIESA